MTDSPTNQLTAYHELHERWVEKFGKNRAWWPRDLIRILWIVSSDGKRYQWYYRGQRMDPDHALRLVESYARDALVEADWIDLGGGAFENEELQQQARIDDALLAEIEREGTGL